MAMNRPLARASLALLFTLVGSRFAAGAERLEDHWKSLPGYTVEKLSVKDLERADRDYEGIPAAVLDEYAIRGYSRWRIQPRADRAAFEVTVLRMLDPTGAFGVLTYRRGLHGNTAQGAGLEVAHYLASGELAFWKGRFCVIVSVGSDTSAEEAASLGRQLGAAIAEENLAPVTVLNMPPTPTSLSFFMGPSGISAEEGLPGRLAALAGFQSGVELTAAEYPLGERLYLLGYPTPALASEAHSRIRPALDPAWNLKQTGILVALQPKGGSAALLEAVAYKPRVQWVKDRPPPTLQEEAKDVLRLFLGWFVFTLYFIGATLGSAAAILLLRYGLRRRFPRLADNDQMIRMGLSDPPIRARD